MVGRPMARRPLLNEEMRLMLLSWRMTVHVREGESLRVGIDCSCSAVEGAEEGEDEAGPLMVWPGASVISGAGCFEIGVRFESGSSSRVVCVAILWP